MTDFDLWRDEISGAKRGAAQDWGDEGPDPLALEILLDAIESAGLREDVERRISEQRGW